jgi:hypothetical protein
MAATARVTQLPISEAEWQSRVIDYAKLRGWLVHHTRPARTEKGWRTALEGDAGFPDLVLARRGQVLFVELKKDGESLRANQRDWLNALMGPRLVFEKDLDDGRHAIYVWRPAQWDLVQRILA